MNATYRKKGIFLAFLSTLFGSCGVIFYKPMMEDGLSPFVIGFVESIVIALILLFNKKIFTKSNNPNETKGKVIASLCQGAGSFSYLVALSKLDPITFSFISRNQATITILFGLMLSERPSLISWGFIISSLAGSMALTLPEYNNTLELSGVYFTILFCLFYSLRTTILKIYPCKNTISLVFWGHLTTAFFMIASFYYQPVDLLSMISMNHAIQITLIATLAVLASNYLFIKAIEVEKISLVSSVRLFSPYIIMVYYFLFRNDDFVFTEKLSAFLIMTFAIFLLIFEELYLSYKSSKKKNNPTG